MKTMLNVGCSMETKKMAKIFKALSNPNRLELYLQIVKQHEKSYKTCGGCLISEITKSLNIGAPTISHHLKELSGAELIYTEKKGRYLVAKVNEDVVNQINEYLKIQ
jgi:ArsR family transcriptional regulator, arsenate/arsenite/antimonite-responsive transcriptional repressor